MVKPVNKMPDPVGQIKANFVPEDDICSTEKKKKKKKNALSVKA